MWCVSCFDHCLLSSSYASLRIISCVSVVDGEMVVFFSFLVLESRYSWPTSFWWFNYGEVRSVPSSISGCVPSSVAASPFYYILLLFCFSCRSKRSFCFPYLRTFFSRRDLETYLSNPIESLPVQ